MSNLDIISKIIRQRTTKIGEPVTNLIGPVPAEAPPLEVSVDQSWLLLRLPGTRLLTPDEFYAQFTTVSDRGVEERKTINGLLEVSDPAANCYLLRGVCDVVGTAVVPIQIATGSSNTEWSVWQDGTLQTARVGPRNFTITLAAGRHLLEILVAGGTFSVSVLPSFRISAIRDLLTPPVWAAVDPGYMDPRTGSPAVHLTWYNQTRAGGWSLQRREIRSLGPIYQVGVPDANGEFGLTVVGDFSGNIEKNSTLYAGLEHLGTALSVTYDPVETITFNAVLYTGLTLIRARLPHGRSATNPYWLGRALGTGMFKELSRVQRVGSDRLVSYTDVAVVYGNPYEYVLQAYGLFDANALSDPSEVRYVRAGDVFPPGPIIINGRSTLDPLPDDPLAAYPQVRNRRAVVLFQTPIDEDYAGVRTFFRYIAYQAAAGNGALPNEVVLATPVLANLKDYVVHVISGPCAGQARTVVSSIPNKLTLAADDIWYEAVLGQTAPTSASVIEVYRLLEVVTDYGLPNTQDQFSFDVLASPADPTLPLYGRFMFATFDQAGNVQAEQEMAIWEYDPNDDTFIGENQPPVIKLRQLRPGEQDTVTYGPDAGVGFRDSGTYALLELGATDPVDGETGVIIEYRARRSTLGVTTQPSGVDTLTDADQVWVPNEHMNYLVEIVDGPAQGEARRVVSNTENQLIVEPWDPARTPDVGINYQMTWVTGIDASLTATTLDNPLDVRSRFVAVEKTQNINWFLVRAYDRDGIYSDEIPYTPDFDNDPEVSFVDPRIDTNNDKCFVVGSVDDDTRSLKYWLESTTPTLGGDHPDPTADVGLDPLDPLPGPNEDFRDTSQVKTFDFWFYLDDGQSKTLVIQPYAQPDFVQPGVEFRRVISRSPRTTHDFQPRNRKGETSAEWVRATFFCTPELPVDLTGTISTINFATRTLTDVNLVAGASLDIDRFAPSTLDSGATFQWWLRVVRPDSKVDAFVKLTGNGTNTLQWAGDFDVGANGLGATPAPGWVYEVRPGVTQWKVGLTPNPDVGTFQGAFFPVFFRRDPNGEPLYVQYNSILNGLPPEPFHTVKVDPDEVASIADIDVTKTGFRVTVTLVEPDDDVKHWVGFTRKGQLPVLSGVPFPTGTSGSLEGTDLDRHFVRFDAALAVSDSFDFDAGPGTWYAVACPINGYGQWGTCKWRSIAVDGETNAGITKIDAFQYDEDPGAGAGVAGAEAWNLLVWDHNASIVSPDSNITYYFQLSAQFEGGGIIALETRRIATWDAVSGPTMIGKFNSPRSADGEETGFVTDGRNYELMGSYLHDTGMKRGLNGTSGSIVGIWKYTLELFSETSLAGDPNAPPTSTTTKLNQWDRSVLSYFTDTAVHPPEFVLGADVDAHAVVATSGACTLFADTTGTRHNIGQYTHSVHYPILPGSDPANYRIQYSISGNGGLTWKVHTTSPILTAPVPSATVPGAYQCEYWIVPFGGGFVQSTRINVTDTITQDLEFLTHPGADYAGYGDFILVGRNTTNHTVYVALSTSPTVFAVLPQLNVNSTGTHPNWTVLDAPAGRSSLTLFPAIHFAIGAPPHSYFATAQVPGPISNAIIFNVTTAQVIPFNTAYVIVDAPTGTVRVANDAPGITEGDRLDIEYQQVPNPDGRSRIRIHNTPATTSRMIVQVNYDCDTILDNRQSVSISYMLEIIRATEQPPVRIGPYVTTPELTDRIGTCIARP